MIAQSIDRPRHHDIELAARGIAMQLIKGRAPVATLGPGDTAVAVGLDDGVAHALGSGPQLVLLVGRGLVGGADAQIQGGAHFSSRKTLILQGQ